MMIRISTLLVLLLPFLLQAQSSFKVMMNIKGLGTNMIKVVYQKNGKSKADSLKPVSPDHIVWEGEIAEPHLVRMDVLDTSLYLRVGKAVLAPPQLQFLLKNAALQIDGEAANLFAVSIKSKDADIIEYEKLRMQDLPLAKKIWEISKEQNRKMRAGDTTGNYQLSQDVRALRKKNQELRIKFVDEHASSLTSILILQSLSLILKPEEMLAKYDRLDESVRNTDAGRNLGARIEGNRRISAGKPVLPFRQAGLDGNMVDLEALKGKVVLVDFWGSWCGPCRKSHPAMKELYAKYKSKGFEIVGISNEVITGKNLPDQEKAWKKAIAEDGITWLHVLYNPEVKDIVKEYDINAYPTKYLIDQNGNYLMKVPGNSDEIHRMLDKKLEELLGAGK